MTRGITVVSGSDDLNNVPNKYAANRLLATLPEQTIALLAPDLRQSTLPQGLVCYGAGDPIDQVYFPRTGMISLLVTTGDGAMVETSSVGREGAVGVQCGNGPCLSFTARYSANRRKFLDHFSTAFRGCHQPQRGAA